MQKYYPVIVAYLLIFLFIYTATGKLMNIASFKAVLHAMPFIPSLSGQIAYIVPFAEIITAVLLLFRSTQLFGFITALVLLFAFTSFLVYALIVSDHLPCSCGGIISSMSWTQHILFNLFFIALCIAAICYKRNGRPIQAKQKSLLQ